jgi:hypothetical protein
MPDSSISRTLANWKLERITILAGWNTSFMFSSM